MIKAVAASSLAVSAGDGTLDSGLLRSFISGGQGLKRESWDWGSKMLPRILALEQCFSTCRTSEGGPVGHSDSSTCGTAVPVSVLLEVKVPRGGVGISGQNAV